MKWNIGNRRVWLFRGLVVIAAGLITASFIMPWWIADRIDVSRAPEPPSILLDAIRIYGHGLQHSLVGLREYVEADETPFYQMVLAWIYLAASVGLILGSAWLKGRKGKWLLGGIGLTYITYAAIAIFVVVAGRLGDFGMPLQGWGSIIEYGGDASIHGGLRFGYYLAYAAGGMCIVLALLRDKIVGKPKLGA